MPVPSRRIIFLCGLASAILMAAVALYRPAFIRPLDDRAYDALLRWARTDPPSGRVVIVDVDDNSLTVIGQWPWRRDLIGQFIARLREMGAAVIALDVIFAEPDRADVSDRKQGRVTTSESGSSHPDAALAEALRRGRVVLGYGLTFEGSLDSSACVLHPLGVAVVESPRASADSALFRASGAICSLSVLSQAAGASGFLNAVPDADGVLRRVPLLMEYQGRIYPALTLAAVLIATDTHEIALRVINANTGSLMLGRRVVPLDGKGNLLLRYRGSKRTFPFISAVDVVKGRVAPDAFRNKVVLVGATALGIRDVVTTPLDTLFPGVEVQATVADNLLQQDFRSRPRYAAILEAVATLSLGLTIAFLVAGAGSAMGALGSGVALVALWTGAEWALGMKGVFVSPIVPVAGLILSLVAPALARFAYEHRRTEQAVRERHVAQRLMVQSLLSLTETRDAETGRHSRRTMRYAGMLAEQVSAHPRFHGYLTPERIEMLASLAPLHDIGKVGVPDDLLNKPGRLTDLEFAEMRRHPSHGLDVLIRAEQRVGVYDDVILSMAKDIVYTHHEWWDGHGYPQGLRGEQIPISGRIVALVDVYDALTTRRVYRPPMPHEKAFDLIVDGRGTHFDPAVVEAFMHLAPAFRGISMEHQDH